MDSKFFLQSFSSKESVNTSEGLNISLKGKRKLLPTNDYGEILNQYEVYNEERNKCNKIRLTCQVNAVCTNVLYNCITEIVKDEGSSGLSFLNYGIISGESGDSDAQVIDGELYFKENKASFWSGDTTLQAIRDTQLSNFGYVYHCGRNIFNNHLIRSKTFKAVCDFGEGEGKEYFNTIYDHMRDSYGDNVKDRVYFPISSGLASRGSSSMDIHLYEYDDISTYKECIDNRLVETFEGWVGFYNKSKIKTYKNYGTKEEEVLNIDKPIAYMNGNDFVDMYPDRTLYSFVPKYNKFKKRVEKNWNYCLTYPSSSITEGFDEIIETNNGVNALKALYFNENTIADNGTRQLVIYGIAKHGLSVGDYVNVYKTVSKTEGDKVLKNTELVLENAKVTEVVDEFIFTVSSTVQLSKNWIDLSTIKIIDDRIELDGIGTFQIFNGVYLKEIIYNMPQKEKYYVIEGTNYVNLDKDGNSISYKKVVGGVECDYYVRIFSKIPNFKFASGDTSNEYEIYKNDGEAISEYQKKEYDFESHLSRLAFAKNAYSDNIGEIVFTDDIDISNLRDNLGRPLTSIYLTIVKNNSGYKEWYGFDLNNWTPLSITEDNVEFSHCFGRVTCGIETSEETRFDNEIRSINKIHSINKTVPLGFNVDLINGDRDLEPNVNKINSTEVYFDLDKHYYGDLCYYDNFNAIERSIQPILHRFNTAQRESIDSKSKDFFNTFTYDEIRHDDYDYAEYAEFSGKEENCNSFKEGYYYNPHYEIKIKSFDKLETVMPDFLTITKIQIFGDIATFTSLENHYLSIGDKSILYDVVNNKYYHCNTINGVSDNPKKFSCNLYDDNGNIVPLASLFYYGLNERPIDDFKLFKMDNLEIPTYANILRDGTCRLVWRNILNNGFNLSDKTIEEYPFTNGAFYINKSVNLFVKRQDPYGSWGLYSSEDIEGVEFDIDKEDNFVKDTEIVC